ncbi:hypothetical protein [Paenibacillus segetis]|uniref:Lipoprotein n=1 Tax=Paenibacillus segetis TaxID=1325360 RepID=A0ABQ1Y7I7_9BACL|nr:hypothetical protein [Paenibacillus segetis]GGH15141.1 hypothetical protein GCM10008013_09170 [Paenibacillus segetis]
MSKKYYIFIAIITLCSIMLDACSYREEIKNTSNVTTQVSTATNIALKYKLKELEAAPPDNAKEINPEQIAKREKSIKSLTTKEFFDKQSADHVYEWALRAALIKQSDLKITYISFRRSNVTEDSSELTYEATLRFGEEKLTLNGTMTLLKEGGSWKVNDDQYNADDILEIINTND